MKNIIITGFIGLLLIGCGSGGTQTESSVAEDALGKAWYMKTVAKATADDGSQYVQNKAGIFGELAESQDTKDRHDIAGFGTGILQVVFPKTQWDENNGDYISDYRALSDEETKKVWTFQVKNQRDVNLEDAPLQLLLYGPYDLTPIDENGRLTYEESLSKDTDKKTSITLIDIDNQVEYSFAELKTLQLNMDGLHTRTFRWVIGAVTQEDYAPLTIPTTSKSSVLKSTEATFKIAATPVTDSKFGIPPSF